MALASVPLLPRFFGMANAAPRAFGFPEPDMTTVVVRPMQFPVEGTVSWTDTYGACRDGCSRKHEGQDLIGQKLQRLLACVDGTVVGLKYSAAGNYLYLQDADGWHYGYLHINNDDPGTDNGKNPRQWAFAPGIDVGSKVRRGQHIAYLGDSGNAEGTVPHCHFELRKPADAWYHAQAVNAKYSLDAAAHGSVGVPSSTFAPWVTAEGFIGQQYVDFLARLPRSDELVTWKSALESGARSPSDLIDWILTQPGSDDLVAPLIRLYWAVFNRLPDTAGLIYWIGRMRAGTQLSNIADRFSTAPEFRRRFDSLSDGAFVDQVYRKILGRAADGAGHAYWVRRLSSGITRGNMMRYFAESDYNLYVMHRSVRITQVYAGMLHRAPDPKGFVYWLNLTTNHGTPLQTMIGTIEQSASYRRRFPSAKAADAGRTSTVAPRTSSFSGPAPTTPTTAAPAPTNPSPTTQPPPTAAPGTAPVPATSAPRTSTTTSAPASSPTRTKPSEPRTSVVP